MKGFRKIKQKLFKNKEPRQLEDIRKEYADLSAKLSQVVYVAYVNDLAAADIKKRMQEVNQEADRRNQLDRAAQPKEESQSDVKPE